MRGAIPRLAFARPFGGQLLQSINSLRRRYVFGRHHYDSLQVGQLRAAMLNACQHGLVLHKDESGVRMRENINQLRIGDVGAPGHIGGSGQKNGVVRKNPLQTVVGEKAHMLAGLDSQGNQGCRKIEAAFIGFTEADRHKRARLVFFAKARKAVIAKRGIRIDLGESGSVFKIRHTMKAGLMLLSEESRDVGLGDQFSNPWLVGIPRIDGAKNPLLIEKKYRRQGIDAKLPHHRPSPPLAIAGSRPIG